MNCEQVRAAYLAGVDADAEHQHVESCAACFARVGHLKAVRKSLNDPSVWEEPSPELGAQVVGLVTSAASGRSAVAAPRRPMRRMWPAAAVIVALVTVGATVVALRPPAPDWEVALPGTDLAPGASGVVQGWKTETGTRMVMMVDGLEPAPDGFVYEFWLSGEDAYNSAGTFLGAERVELFSGVGRGDHPRLWVTIEPIDDDATPSYDNVLLDTG